MNNILKYFFTALFFIFSLLMSYLLNVNLGTEWLIFILIATLLWWYMAMNIWANDVANNMGPAVWSKALTIGGAIVLAFIFEAAWALIAGWDVVDTVKSKIISIDTFESSTLFIYAMMSALLAAALWLNLATYFSLPVSTTHSIVGWVMWAWIAALWVNVVNWAEVWKIAMSWVISPVLWWIIAAIFLYLIKKTIIIKDDKISAANKYVPIFVWIMSWAFTTYIALKWVKQLIKIDFAAANILWLIAFAITYFYVKRKITRKKHLFENSRASINKMFIIPLIFSAALLSFAHGANDVANAIGPLAAIYDAVINGSIWAKAWIPLWIMLIWALGISVWLALYGPKIMKTVWSTITELDNVRAFCVALSAAITVIFASKLWLPVSSTHIAIGAIFWIGLLREWLHKKETSEKKQFVKRTLVFKIVSAWLITLPVVSFLSAMLYLWMLNIFA